jgi:superfamily II DNA or RNA helicase
MSERRHFSRAEKNALYMIADGKCCECGADLCASWHGDHITPYSKGGETNIANGQALCPSCNLKKGNKMASYQPRKFQDQAVNIVRRKIQSGERTAFFNVAPGCGKTGLGLLCADALLSLGCDSVIYVAPRLNLCRQIETDANDLKKLLPSLGSWPILHRNNILPLIGVENPSKIPSIGYATTYSSINSDLLIHIAEAQKRKVLLILDEAHTLGLDPKEPATTSESIRRIADIAQFVIVMTGSRYRHDGKPILLVDYTAPDAQGRVYPVCDLEVSYSEAIRNGWNRPIEYYISGGTATFEYLDSLPETTDIARIESGIGDIVRQKKVYEPLTDKVISLIRDWQKRDPVYCGLISATDQKHARAISKYVAAKYPEVRQVLAVSEDGALAADSLREFRVDGAYDLLITCEMAYIGYDHKPLTVLGHLNAKRSAVFNEQLEGRVLRTRKDAKSPECGCVVTIGDRKMLEHIEARRAARDAGLCLKEGEEFKNPLDSPLPEKLSYLSDAELTVEQIKGLDSRGDIAGEEIRIVEEINNEYGMGVPPSVLARFLRDKTDLLARPTTFINNFPAPRQPRQQPERTAQEQHKSIRSEIISRLTKQADGILQEAGYWWSTGTEARPWQFGDTNKLVKRRFNLTNGVQSAQVSQLEEIAQWLQTEHLPFAQKVKGARCGN